MCSQGSVIAEVESDQTVADSPSGRTAALTDFTSAIESAVADNMIGTLAVDSNVEVGIAGMTLSF